MMGSDGEIRRQKPTITNKSLGCQLKMVTGSLTLPAGVVVRALRPVPAMRGEERERGKKKIGLIGKI